ncbi:DNA polymerase III subunit alpha [Candidatus Azobacteroides pseudotrichonymphae]|uniref:DNA polymerase III subunit alpha n=1 Tax=Azobacteroides pseudotrichonymphae genomovar. CFP2 TaxID=511995 RepID=B6YQZ2_AZOPC|nr:DNA polymerase III subunit alpha [Candidatus Azobacteroides pseudotrichonymphae]BAG83614.1 DNA polymerase III alpha subunit [Candidatus Azobacteroides pseudotrichonymphae genomovar. CFP2]
MIPFVHLHVHSYYSQLDGMSSITGLVDKACHYRMKALALTDHGNMFGIKEFYDCIKKKNKNLHKDQKIKPILGVEAYVARRTRFDKSKKVDSNGWHLILLAKNKQGYKNLCKLVSISWIEGFYYRPRIDKECLEQYSEGLIATSACLGGEIPQKILERENTQEAEQAILWFKKVFENDFYLELQRHQTNKENSDQTVFLKQTVVNQSLLKLAKTTDTKIICTNDVHFIEEEHAEAHDRLICLGTGKYLNDPKRMRYTKQEWFKSIEEMNAIFSDLPESLGNTVEIADKIEPYNIDLETVMPIFSIPESFATEETYCTKYTEETLRQEFNKEDKSRFDKLGGYNKVIRIKLEADYLKELTLQKAKNRYGNPIPNAILERLEFELETMKTMGFPGYFLIVQDFIQAARNMGVSVGPGRGSVAGSVVAYCLEITDIDPLKYDLLFERFLNPDRISMPDIDIDFDDDGRMDIVRWVTKKYGKEKVAHIVTYGTMATKSSIRDVGRVQGLSMTETEKLTKLIPDRLPEDESGQIPKINIKNCIKYISELREVRYSNNKNLSDTLKYAEMLEGTVRQTGIHACGIIIGADDLTNFLPLATVKEKRTNEDILVTQYEGSMIESIGLIKMDFLGLKTLSIIKNTIANVKRSKNKTIDINHIPNDDKLTYELYSRGQTIGVFQFESSGMQKYLRELRPTQFEDLIAMNALYRPGPMAYIPDFINRKHEKNSIIYDFPEMESRLKETYGITVYQEQVMLLSRDLAGFSRGQSDELRKAMGKKLKNKMEQFHDKFIQGATKNGFGPKKKLEKIWNDWTKFAEYAFNKSHATCYSWISYQTAYLKVHYPAEFLAANLTHNRDNIVEITKFIDECRAMGIRVLGPDINESELNFTVNKEGHIRFGLGGIKGVGKNAVETIVKEREENGAFKNIFDFIERINLTACNKKSIESLSLSGTFDSFIGIKREQFFAENSNGETFIETLIRYGNKFQLDKNSDIGSLFGNSDPMGIAKLEIPLKDEWNNIERLNKEKDLLGVYVSSHPLDEYYLILKYICTLRINDFEKAKITQCGQELILGGMVTNYREGHTKAGSSFGILKLEDFTGSREIPLFGKDYIKYRKYGHPNVFLYIVGAFMPNIQLSKNVSFKIKAIQLLNEIVVQKITILLPLHRLNEKVIRDLESVTKNKHGNTSLYFNIREGYELEDNNEEKQISILLKSENGKYFIDKKFVQYLEENKIKFEIN